MKITRKAIGMLILACTMLPACGGSSSSSPAPEVQPTKATLTLSSTVTGSIAPGTIIAGYDVTIKLPAGITVKSSVAPPLTDDGVVTHVTATAPPSSLVYGIYTAATASAPGTVRVIAAKADGFSVGNFTILNGDITPGFRPRSADFSQPTFTVSDGTGAYLTGQMNVTATAVIR